jgi:hypothetical protein
MHTYRPGNLRDEIPKEGGSGPPRAVTPRKKKKNIKEYTDTDRGDVIAKCTVAL